MALFQNCVSDCTGVIIALHNPVSFSNECIECIKSMYYCAVRKYAEKYWLISIFLIKEIKNNISKDWDTVLLIVFIYLHVKLQSKKEKSLQEQE